jgi:hypothetical protein
MDIETGVRTGRIIITAMLVGVLAFAAIAFYFVEHGNFQVNRSLSTTLLLAWAVLAVVEIAAYVTLRTSMLKQLPDRASLTEQSPKIADMLATRTIIGAAMAEGLALFATVIYLLTGQRSVLVLVALGLLVVAIQLPSVTRWRGEARQLSA